MARVPSAVSGLVRRLRGEHGTSLIELVIVSAVSLVILLAVLSLLDSGTKAERGTEARHSALLALRGTLGRIDKEMRQAVSIAPSSTISHLDMCTYISGTKRRIAYDVTGGQLTRTIYSSPTDCTGTIGSPVALVTHVSAATFCYNPPGCTSTAPSSDTSLIRLTVAATPEVFSGGPITLATDIRLRNVFT